MLVLCAAYALLMFHIVWSRRRREACQPAEFSLEKYRPMERLLSAGDYEFVEVTPGFRPALMRRLEARRARIVRGYLRSLSEDFDRISTLARMCLAESEVDRPDLSAELVRQRIQFARMMLVLRCQLAFSGVRGLNVWPLMSAVQSVHQQLRSLTVAVP